MKHLLPMVIFKLGSLETYTYEYEDGDVAENCLVYWRNHSYPAGFGPFKSIASAMDHFARTIKNDRRNNVVVYIAPENTGENVVYVDFVNKKRAGGSAS